MAALEVILASVGISGATAIGLSIWIGSIWKKRIEDREKTRLEFLAESDQEIQKRRIDAYQDAWKVTEILPRWPTRKATYEELRALRETLRDWYFRTGGMFLSEHTRKHAYETLQKSLCDVGDDKTSFLDDDEYERFRKLCSSFRTAMTEDILSRRPPGPTAG